MVRELSVYLLVGHQTYDGVDPACGDEGRCARLEDDLVDVVDRVAEPPEGSKMSPR